MKIKSSLALFSLFVFLAGCTSLQSGGELQYGRQALLKGSNETALGYFYSAAQRDPNCVYAMGALRSRVFGVMSDGQSISLADFHKPGKLWNGRLPAIEKKILPGSI
jgi:hypothetical protein